jgi:uncharacterized protein YjbI with pentapeptide repeats
LTAAAVPTQAGDAQPVPDATRTARRSAARSSPLMTRVEQYAKVLGAIAVTVGLIKTGFDWKEHRADKRHVERSNGIAVLKDAERSATARDEATNRAVTELSSPEEFGKVRAIDTLTYLVGKNSSLLDKVYPEVLSFVARRTRFGDAASCGSATSLQEAKRAQSTAGVTSALEFLRRFGRTSRTVRVSLPRVDLTHANLSYANLSQTDLRRGMFDGACLDHATLDGASLDSARFTGASLRHALVRSVGGFKVVFNEADLDSARFDGSTLENISFVNANLARAWFENARLTGADFSGAKVAWSYWRSARLTGSQYWSEVDTTSVAGALLYDAVGMRAADMKWLRRFGACVDSISLGEWDTRLTTPKARDTRCGKPSRSPMP